MAAQRIPGRRHRFPALIAWGIATVVLWTVLPALAALVPPVAIPGLSPDPLAGIALAHPGDVHGAVAPDLHPTFVALELVAVLASGFGLAGWLAQLGRGKRT